MNYFKELWNKFIKFFSSNKYDDFINDLYDEDILDENDIDIVIRYIDNKEMAQTSPTIFNTYSLFYEGKFITNEILSIKKFEKIVGEVK